MNETFTSEQISQLQAEYATVETCSVNMLPKFHAMFAKMTDKQLDQVSKAGIKFVSKLALNAANRRNGWRIFNRI